MFKKKEKDTDKEEVVASDDHKHAVQHTEHGHKHSKHSIEAHEHVAHEAHGSHGGHGAHGGDHLHGHELVKVIKERKGIINARQIEKISMKKFHVPVIGHFANKSVEFKSIIEAWQATGIPYSLIFEACIGKIYKAKNVIWEFKKGNHFIKYKAFYINAASNYKRKVGFNG